jgi:predicted cupin superfamily sugar epimerase
MDRDELIERLNLKPLEGEGGLWSEIYRDENGSAIYFMVISPDFSAWHRLTQPELWIHIAGDPIEIFTLNDGFLSQNIVGNSSHQMHFRVPPNTWMAARSANSWSLVVCSLAPAFSGMELASRNQLLTAHPYVTNLPNLFHE